MTDNLRAPFTVGDRVLVSSPPRGLRPTLARGGTIIRPCDVNSLGLDWVVRCDADSEHDEVLGPLAAVAEGEMAHA